VASPLTYFRHTISTMASLPAVKWQFKRRFNPEVIGILQKNGFTKSQAICVASDPRVRTFAGNLRRGMELFNIGVGTIAMNELKAAGLLEENAQASRSRMQDYPPQFLFLAPILSTDPMPYASSKIKRLFKGALLIEGAGSGTDRGDQLSEVRVKLQSVRMLFSHNKYDEAKDLVDNILKTIREAISKGNSMDDPFLSYYYTAKVMKKVLQGHQKMFREGAGKSSVQVIILDQKGEKVLVQKRGMFKRLFPDTITVSANAKPKPEESMEAAAAMAVEDEIGISVDPSRFKHVGPNKGFFNYLCSYDFHAFSAHEEKILKNTYEKMAKMSYKDKSGLVKYDEKKRCLSICTVDSKIDSAQLKSEAKKIESETHIPFIYPVFDNDTNSLLVYRLNDEEEQNVKMLIAEKEAKKCRALSDMKSRIDDDILEGVDSDSMKFVHWLKLRNDFLARPEDFALDLTGPYFGSNDVWLGMGMKEPQDILGIDESAAGVVCVSGGKAANTYILRQISRDNGGFIVPDSAVLTTSVFERLVLGNLQIQGDVELLDRTTDEKNIKKISKRIRDRIEQIELPEDLKRKIAIEFKKLGCDIAVRSSATAEDQKKISAAGLADTALHMVTTEQVYKSVKCVWASLFTVGFINERKEKRISNVDARMAVLLQKFIVPRAAGVIFSFQQSTERPVYEISAQPGLGEGVVQGEGTSDNWLVGLLADVILQKNIQKKDERYIQKPGGGIKKEKIGSVEPSLTDEEVLAVAKVARVIHEAFRNDDLAGEIDIEYVMPSNAAKNEIVIVQTRPKIKSIVRNLNDKPVMKVKAVDESRIPKGTEIIDLYDKALVAYPGAASAKIYIDHYISARRVPPGCILVAQNTNNDYNSVFGSLLAVITTDGDTTSHAGQHAYDKCIPCLVGAKGSFEHLNKYDGVKVTFDSRKKKVYIGDFPVVEQELRLDIWLPDAKAVKENMEKVESQEAFRKWEDSKDKRPFVFFEDFEGRWRRRSGAYHYFQLDYYYKGWDRLTEILNDLFKGRSPWKLMTQNRQFKDKGLFHEVKENDPESIYYFMTGVKDVSIKDFQALFDARWEGFRKFAAFTNSVQAIDVTNVESLADNIVEIFAWMHFGFWLDTVVGRAAWDQLKYISDEGAFHNFMRDRAIMGLPKEKSVDPLRRDVPAGKVLNLTLNKDKEIYSVLEIIRSHPDLAELFINKEIDVIREQLNKINPSIFTTIDSWSMKYKNVIEHLDVFSDTDKYLMDLKNRIHEANSIGEGMAISMLEWYMNINSSPEPTLEELRKKDPIFLLVLKGLVRLSCAMAKNSNWSEIDSQRKTTALVGITNKEIEDKLPQTLERVRKQIEERKDLTATVNDIFSNYPELKELATLYKMQLALREDGHHLILPLQRKIGKMMLEVGRAFTPAVFSKPEDIYDISTDELVALLKDKDPLYIKQTFNRWKILEKAEDQLTSKWSMTQNDLADLADLKKAAVIWNDLVAKGYIEHGIDDHGRFQNKFYSVTDWRQLDIPSANDEQKKKIFEIYRIRVKELDNAITSFEKSTKEACSILDQQIAGAGIERVKVYYAGEKERLMERVNRLKERMEKLN